MFYSRTTKILISPALGVLVNIALLLSSASAQTIINPGDEMIIVPPGASGAYSDRSLDCPLCSSAHSPTRLQDRANRDQPGIGRIVTFMTRNFEVSPFMYESEIEALVRSEFSLIGFLGALGSLSKSLYDIRTELIDLATDKSVAAEIVATSTRQAGDISLTVTGSPVGMPIPEPEIDLIDTTLVHHMRAPLRRGHEYQIKVTFEVRAQVERSILDPFGLTAFANANFFGGIFNQSRGLFWNECRVSLAPDTYADIKTDINQIDKRQIEESLEAKYFIVSLILPEKHGGQLETVIDLVENLIQQSEEAGFRTRKAKEYFDRAMAWFDKDQYRASYYSLTKAYEFLAHPGRR